MCIIISLSRNAGPLPPSIFNDFHTARLYGNLCIPFYSYDGDRRLYVRDHNLMFSAFLGYYDYYYFFFTVYLYSSLMEGCVSCPFISHACGRKKQFAISDRSPLGLCNACHQRYVFNILIQLAKYIMSVNMSIIFFYLCILQTCACIDTLKMSAGLSIFFIGLFMIFRTWFSMHHYFISYVSYGLYCLILVS